MNEFLKKMHLSEDDNVFFGVCGGFAEVTGWPSWAIRLVTLVSISAGFGLFVYLLLALLLPEGEQQ